MPGSMSDGSGMMRRVVQAMEQLGAQADGAAQ